MQVPGDLAVSNLPLRLVPEGEPAMMQFVGAGTGQIDRAVRVMVAVGSDPACVPARHVRNQRAKRLRHVVPVDAVENCRRARSPASIVAAMTADSIVNVASSIIGRQHHAASGKGGAFFEMQSETTRTPVSGRYSPPSGSHTGSDPMHGRFHARHRRNPVQFPRQGQPVHHALFLLRSTTLIPVLVTGSSYRASAR